MNASPVPHVIFLHLPKTGGMTLRQIVARQYGRRERLEFTKRHVREARAFLKRPQAERDQYRLLYGHMAFGLHEALSGETRYITMLRDPVERVISEYYGIILRRAEKRGETAPALEDWITHTIRGSAMTRLLVGFRPDAAEASLYDDSHPLPEDAADIAIANLTAHFAVVGLTEAFDASLLLMRRALGWRSVAYVPQNVGRRRRKLESVSADARALIEHHVTDDMRVYQAARRLYAAQAAAYGPGLEADAAAFAGEKERYARRKRLLAPLLENRLAQKIRRRMGWL